MADLSASQQDFCVRESDLVAEGKEATPSPTFLSWEDAPTMPLTKEPTPSPTNLPTISPTKILNAQLGPTQRPTFEFKGPPVSLAPTTESWGFMMNHSDPVPLIYVGNNGKFDVPYPLGPCQSDGDMDEDVSMVQCWRGLCLFHITSNEKLPSIASAKGTSSVIKEKA